MWERGLKYCPPLGDRGLKMVAPFVGAWVEIAIMASEAKVEAVAPFVGAWVEILS